MQGETYPLVFVEVPGKVVCTVTGRDVQAECSFEVVGDVPVNVIVTDKNKQEPAVCLRGSSTDTDMDKGSAGGRELVDIPSYTQELKTFPIAGIKPDGTLALQHAIGKGSYGTVHRALWRGTVVAAKVIGLPRCTIEEVRREIDSCKKVQHPNILSLLGVVYQENGVILIANLVRGPNLHDLVLDSQYSRLSFALKLHVAVQISQAIMFLHTSVPQLAHLDIKPANLLVEMPNYHTYLCDFGLSKAMTNTSAIGSKTMLAGTPGFQPPEQLRSEALGIAADVYAFGGVLVVLFGEQPLWPGLSPYQILCKVTVMREQPPVDHLPTII